MIDCFSKYAFSRSISKKTAKNVVESTREMLDDYYNIIGNWPTAIHSDNGSEFIANDFKELMKEKNI